MHWCAYSRRLLPYYRRKLCTNMIWLLDDTPLHAKRIQKQLLTLFGFLVFCVTYNFWPSLHRWCLKHILKLYWRRIATVHCATQWMPWWIPNCVTVIRPLTVILEYDYKLIGERTCLATGRVFFSADHCNETHLYFNIASSPWTTRLLSPKLRYWSESSWARTPPTFSEPGAICKYQLLTFCFPILCNVMSHSYFFTALLETLSCAGTDWRRKLLRL